MIIYAYIILNCSFSFRNRKSYSFVLPDRSETRPTIQLHFRWPDAVLGARVVHPRVRRGRSSTLCPGGVRLGGPRWRRRRWPIWSGRRIRRARGGRRRTGTTHVGQPDGRPTGLHTPTAVAVGRAPVGRVRVQLAWYQRPHVAYRLHTQLGRQADHFRYVHRYLHNILLLLPVNSVLRLSNLSFPITV